MSVPPPSAPVLTETSLFEEAWQQWHDELEHRRREPHGFLAYTSFNLLGTEPQRFDDVPGTWTSGDEGVIVQLDAGQVLDVDGVAVRGRHVWGVIGERTFHRARFEDAVIEVSRRGGRDIVRPLHPDHDLRTEYRGTPTFAPDERWVIEGVFEPSEEREIPIAAAIDTIEHTHTTPGNVRFAVGGVEVSATLISRGGDAATLLFRDATSGVTTYGASRTLAVTLPPAGEQRIVLDFNRASNLQCAYTDFSPCPLAPRENWLPFAVQAGEKTPLDRTS
ncbi:DUF1684 domain-containing protein [Microbacterium sp. NPDC055903]